MMTKAADIFEKLSGIVIQIAGFATVFIAVGHTATMLETIVQLGLPVFVAYLARHVAVYQFIVVEGDVDVGKHKLAVALVVDGIIMPDLIRHRSGIVALLTAVVDGHTTGAGCKRLVADGVGGSVLQEDTSHIGSVTSLTLGTGSTKLFIHQLHSAQIFSPGVLRIAFIAVEPKVKKEALHHLQIGITFLYLMGNKFQLHIGGYGNKIIDILPQGVLAGDARHKRVVCGCRGIVSEVDGNIKIAALKKEAVFSNHLIFAVAHLHYQIVVSGGKLSDVEVGKKDVYHFC